MELYVDPAGIYLEQQKDKEGKDRWNGRLDILLLQRDKTGTDFESSKDTLDLTLLRESYSKMLQGGLVYRKDISAHPKAEFLRIVVRDSTSTLSGSVTAKW